MTETALSRAIRDAIRKLGVPCYRVNTGQRGRMNIGVPKGTPDLYTPLAWIECKVPGGRVSDAQQARHEELRRWGVRVHVVRSVEEAVAVMKDELAVRDYERTQGWR